MSYLNAFAESDRAPKETERKSSFCVVIKLGKSALGTSVTFLTSGEAKLYAATRAAACVIQLHQFLPEIGDTFRCVRRGSAAARGTMTRRGPGWVKHHGLKLLWCQEANEQGPFRQMKVHSENSSPAHIGTKTPTTDRNVQILRLQGMDAS